MSVFDRLRTEKLLSFTLILFTLSIGIVIGTLISSGIKTAKASSNAAAPDATPLTIPNPVELSTTFTQIAKQVGPSVVNISTTYNPKPSQMRNRRRQVVPPDEEDQQGGNGMEDFFQRFFGGSPFGMPEMAPHKTEAVGSGVVVDRNGYILTNNHVVDKADKIQVKFPGDLTEYNAKVIGVDSPTDLAVIRVEGHGGLAAAKIGNSDAVQVGDWAMALGSPFNFQETVTAGIISAKNRDVDPQMQFQHFLQTDAAINPGNSGGPLVNMRGEVIGINTAIASRSGQYEGIGFALPINTAVQVYNSIIKNGKVTRGGVGVQLSLTNDPQTPALLKSVGATEGAFVQNVTPGGPADKGGLKDGDVIVAINGRPVHDGDQLIGIVTMTPIGNSLDFTVLREGKRVSCKVTVGDLAQIFPDRFGGRSESAEAKPEGTAVSFGMSIQNLTDAQRQTLGLKEKGGVQVVDVDSNSFAEDVGLARNDVILSINQKPVNSLEDVKRIQATLKPGDAVAFHVLRRSGTGANANWQSQYLASTLPANK
ncbi:MAG TPA: Do family serine endopeptidase [Bryobacteraceae bacterium]|nr:Do family serine endopeptidase [Bryobacteraceae bacterium]